MMRFVEIMMQKNCRRWAEPRALKMFMVFSAMDISGPGAGCETGKESPRHYLQSDFQFDIPE